MTQHELVISVLVVFGLVLVVLGLLMPFFVFKIRNQVVQINSKMTRIIGLLESFDKHASLEVPWSRIEEEKREK
jgi:uncharacterized membrane protein